MQIASLGRSHALRNSEPRCVGLGGLASDPSQRAFSGMLFSQRNPTLLPQTRLRIVRTSSAKFAALVTNIVRRRNRARGWCSIDGAEALGVAVRHRGLPDFPCISRGETLRNLTGGTPRPDRRQRGPGDDDRPSDLPGSCRLPPGSPSTIGATWEISTTLSPSMPAPLRLRTSYSLCRAHGMTCCGMVRSGTMY